MADFKMVDHQDTNEHKVELLVKLWTGNRLKVQSSTWTAYDMKHIYQLANSCRSFFLSVIGQPATGLLVKVLKMRHKTELSGGHWTFMRKMWAFLLANCLSVQDEPFVNIVQADGLYWINRISSRFSRWNDNGINNWWYDVQGNVRSAKSSLYSISYTVHGSCVIITPSPPGTYQSFNLTQTITFPKIQFSRAQKPSSRYQLQNAVKISISWCKYRLIVTQLHVGSHNFHQKPSN